MTDNMPRLFSAYTPEERAKGIERLRIALARVDWTKVDMTKLRAANQQRLEQAKDGKSSDNG